LGTIENIDEDGQLRLKMDGGRMVELDPRKHLHLDHGYAMTSHSSQGQTADRVLIHVDTELGAKDLLNSRMAYVAVSRGAHDAQLFTNDREKLPAALGTMYPGRARMCPRSNPIRRLLLSRKCPRGNSGSTRMRSFRVSALVCDVAFPNDIPRIARA
jgi:hypothetical protein